MFVKLFGKESVRVIDNKLLLNEPSITMNKIFDFLGLTRIDIKPLVSNPTISDPLLLRMNNLMSDLSYHTTNILERKGLMNTKLYSVLGKVSKRVKGTIKSIEKGKDKSISYNTLLRLIPDDIAEILENDFKKTSNYCYNNGILID